MVESRRSLVLFVGKGKMMAEGGKGQRCYVFSWNRDAMQDGIGKSLRAKIKISGESPDDPNRKSDRGRHVF